MVASWCWRHPISRAWRRNQVMSGLSLLIPGEQSTGLWFKPAEDDGTGQRDG